MDTVKERRKYKRIRTDAEIRIDPLAQSDIPNNFRVGNIDNISAGGVLLKYSKPFEIGDTISVNFLGPNSFEIFKITARVIRVEKKSDFGYDICVMFLDLTEDNEKRLNYYLTYD